VEKAELVAAKVKRNAVVEERPGEVDAQTRIGVPGVPDAVAVHVAKVVRLPGVRRQHDRDPRLAETARFEHEGREAEPAAGRREPRSVDAGRPGADRQPQLPGEAPVRLRGDADGMADRDAVHHLIRAGGDALRTDVEDLNRQRPMPCGHAEDGLCPGRVAPFGERCREAARAIGDDSPPSRGLAPVRPEHSERSPGRDERGGGRKGEYEVPPTTSLPAVPMGHHASILTQLNRRGHPPSLAHWVIPRESRA